MACKNFPSAFTSNDQMVNKTVAPRNLNLCMVGPDNVAPKKYDPWRKAVRGDKILEATFYKIVTFCSLAGERAEEGSASVILAPDETSVKPLLNHHSRSMKNCTTARVRSLLCGQLMLSSHKTLAAQEVKSLF